MSTLSINYETGYSRELKDINLMDTDEDIKPIHRVRTIERKRYGKWIEVELACGGCFGYDDEADYKKEKTTQPITCPDCLKSLESQ